jgi:hypothetical protein
LPTNGKWRIDTQKTQERIEKLGEYYDHNLRNGELLCVHKTDCYNSQGITEFRKTSFCNVGQDYDMFFNETPIRILIVGQESKCDDEKFSDRNRKWSNLNCVDWNEKNQHIRETLKTLERIFGIQDNDLYLVYALSNGYKCAFPAIENQYSNLKITKCMKEYCYKHLLKEIEILEPTVLIFQGAWARYENYFNRLQCAYSSNLVANWIDERHNYCLCKFENNTPNVSVIFAAHPGRNAPKYEKSCWPSIDRLQFSQTVTCKDRNDLKVLLCSEKKRLIKERDNI